MLSWGQRLGVIAVGIVLATALPDRSAGQNSGTGPQIQTPPQRVWQLNGRAAQIPLPAKVRYVPNPDPAMLLHPYLVYMPEMNRLLMSVNRDRPHEGATMCSDDQGSTWSETRWISVDAQGNSNAGICLGLTYLGNGKLTIHSESSPGGRFFSTDYGESWSLQAAVPPTSDGRATYGWDPLLVERDAATGQLVRLGEGRYLRTGLPVDTLEGEPQRALIRFSADEGRTWDDEILPPQWYGCSEVALVGAANGDLVAACRLPIPKRIIKSADRLTDHYEGLGVSISKDGGTTWSPVHTLYEYGRHHPSLLRLPSGKLVMVYNVRLGYPPTEDGFPQYGIEAVVSRDHGRTWDLERRYLLMVYRGPKVIGADRWWAAATQGTSVVLLPDGSLLTAFGSGYRVDPDPPGAEHYFPRDIGLIQWEIKRDPPNVLEGISAAPDDPASRNEFDPYATRPQEP